MPDPCPQPGKIAYSSRGEALHTLTKIAQRKKRGLKDLAPYRCRCGAWHLGRAMRRAQAAWKSGR